MAVIYHGECQTKCVRGQCELNHRGREKSKGDDGISLKCST